MIGERCSQAFITPNLRGRGPLETCAETATMEAGMESRKEEWIEEDMVTQTEIEEERVPCVLQGRGGPEGYKQIL